MGVLKSKPQNLYEEDYYLWVYEQIRLIKAKQLHLLDFENLIEEIDDMGSEKLHRLESSYIVLITHLLKYDVQPSKRSRSWLITIGRERGNIEKFEKKMPSLKAKAQEIMSENYKYATRYAALETGLSEKRFPTTCPYTLEQIRDFDFLPESRPL